MPDFTGRLQEAMSNPTPGQPGDPPARPANTAAPSPSPAPSENSTNDQKADTSHSPQKEGGDATHGTASHSPAPPSPTPSDAPNEVAGDAPADAPEPGDPDAFDWDQEAGASDPDSEAGEPDTPAADTTLDDLDPESDEAKEILGLSPEEFLSRARDLVNKEGIDVRSLVRGMELLTLKRPQGQRKLAAFKALRPLEQELGSMPTPEQVRQYHNSHQDLENDKYDFSAGDPERAQIFWDNWLRRHTDESGNPLPGRTVAFSALPDVLRSRDPESYVPLAKGVFRAAAQAAAQQAQNEQHNKTNRARWANAARVLGFYAGEDVMQGYQEPEAEAGTAGQETEPEAGAGQSERTESRPRTNGRPHLPPEVERELNELRTRQSESERQAEQTFLSSLGQDIDSTVSDDARRFLTQPNREGKYMVPGLESQPQTVIDWALTGRDGFLDMVHAEIQSSPSAKREVQRLHHRAVSTRRAADPGVHTEAVNDLKNFYRARARSAMARVLPKFRDRMKSTAGTSVQRSQSRHESLAQAQAKTGEPSPGAPRSPVAAHPVLGERKPGESREQRNLRILQERMAAS